LLSAAGNVLIAAAAVDQHFGYPVDSFDDAEVHFGPATVQNPIGVLAQYRGELLKGGQSLPAKLLDPLF